MRTNNNERKCHLRSAILCCLYWGWDVCRLLCSLVCSSRYLPFYTTTHNCTQTHLCTTLVFFFKSIATRRAPTNEFERTRAHILNLLANATQSAYALSFCLCESIVIVINNIWFCFCFALLVNRSQLYISKHVRTID